jgi:ADP-ribose 1''-phosphate phosphatase
MGASNSRSRGSSGIRVLEGDLFANAPERCVLVHACNTIGTWGSGIAVAFKNHYPDAYQVYTQTCIERGSDLLGTCLLIPAGERDIACLFTSRGFGRAVDPPRTILQSTRSAVEDLLRQVSSDKELVDKPIYGW